VLGLKLLVHNGISRAEQKLPSDTTFSQKRAFSSREVTLVQMRKIGIHFIIYRSSFTYSSRNPIGAWCCCRKVQATANS